MQHQGDGPDPHELMEAFRAAIIRWLDRARHLTPGEGFEIGHIVARLEADLAGQVGTLDVAARMSLIGELQLRLVDVHAPDALVRAAGHLRGVPSRPAAPPLVAGDRVASPRVEAPVRSAPHETAPAAIAPPAIAPPRTLRVPPGAPRGGVAIRAEAEPWRRVPLKRLARAVPSVRILTDPVDGIMPAGAGGVSPK